MARAFAASLMFFFLFSRLAFAWDGAGYRVIAVIADHYLEPSAAQEVQTLLAGEGAATLADVATWVQLLGRERPDVAAWERVNIPIRPAPGSPKRYDALRDCPGGECLVAKIDEFATRLRDRSASPRTRAEALKFLVGLVADLHEPMHCADDEDHGGRDVHLLFLGQHTTLFDLWDNRMLRAIGIGDERAYADGLAARVPAAMLAQWRDGGTADWATESYRIARLIYGGSHEARTLEIFYESDLMPALEVQLQKAGVRLAALLNGSLQ